jgi:hypothetical protein
MHGTSHYFFFYRSRLLYENGHRYQPMLTFIAQNLIMKKILSLAVTTFLSSLVFAQVQINLKDAARYNGDSVVVCGKVFGGRFFSDSKDSLTLLNVGAAYPNQQLTLVIRPEVRKRFTGAPETLFKDKSVCIFGKVSMYNDKPQIILYREDQIMEAVNQ